MSKKLNIVNMNDQPPKEPMKSKKLDILTTNKVNAAPRGRTDKRPEMNPDEIITTRNVERFQAKNKALSRMAKARAAKKKRRKK